MSRYYAHRVLVVLLLTSIPFAWAEPPAVGYAPAVPLVSRALLTRYAERDQAFNLHQSEAVTSLLAPDYEETSGGVTVDRAAAIKALKRVLPPMPFARARETSGEPAPNVYPRREAWVTDVRAVPGCRTVVVTGGEVGWLPNLTGETPPRWVGRSSMRRTFRDTWEQERGEWLLQTRRIEAENLTDANWQVIEAQANRFQASVAGPLARDRSKAEPALPVSRYMNSAARTEAWRPKIANRARQAFLYLNYYRKRLGLPPAEWNPELAAAAEAHARYFTWDVGHPTADSFHEEDPKRSGFVGVHCWERARAFGYPRGCSEVMHFQHAQADPSKPVSEWYDVPYHRGVFLGQRCVAGVGESHGIWVIDYDESGTGITLCPADGDDNVNNLAHPGAETPNPLEVHGLAGNELLGWAITYTSRGNGPIHVGAAHLATLGGKPVECWVNTPTNDPKDSQGVIMMPKHPLGEGVTYVATVQAQGDKGQDLSRRWRFTTAVRPKPYVAGELKGEVRRYDPHMDIDMWTMDPLWEGFKLLHAWEDEVRVLGTVTALSPDNKRATLQVTDAEAGLGYKYSNATRVLLFGKWNVNSGFFPNPIDQPPGKPQTWAVMSSVRTLLRRSSEPLNIADEQFQLSVGDEVIAVGKRGTSERSIVARAVFEYDGARDELLPSRATTPRSQKK